MSKAGACAEGRIVRKDDPLVRVVPEAFSPLIEQLES